MEGEPLPKEIKETSTSFNADLIGVPVPTNQFLKKY